MFWYLFEKSVILQGAITFGFVGASLYLWMTAQPLPDALAQGLWVVLGFWFGTKTQNVINANATKQGR